MLAITRDSLARILSHYGEFQEYKKQELAKLAAAEQMPVAFCPWECRREQHRAASNLAH